MNFETFYNDYNPAPNCCMITAYDLAVKIGGDIIMGEVCFRDKETGITDYDMHYWTTKFGKDYDAHQKYYDVAGVEIISRKRVRKMSTAKFLKENNTRKVVSTFRKRIAHFRDDIDAMYSGDTSREYINSLSVKMNGDLTERGSNDLTKSQNMDNWKNVSSVSNSVSSTLDEMAADGEIVKHADGTYSAA